MIKKLQEVASYFQETRRRIKFPKGISPLIALLVLGTFISFLSPHFLTFINLKNVFVQASVVAILASGMTLVIITGGIDLSVGTVMAMSSCIMGLGMLNLHLGVFLSILLALLNGAFIGFISGTIITKGSIAPFVVTLGMMGIAQGVALLITAGYSMYGFPESFLFFGGGEFLGIPVPIIVMALVYFIMYMVLEYTTLGRYAFAIGGNEGAARLAGINVDLYKIIIYTINGMMAGFAGVVLSSRIASSHPGIGAGFELDAIAAVVIGGTSLSGGEGTMLGTIIGALIMATIKNSLNLLGVSPFIQKIAIGSIIIIAVLIDSMSKKRSQQNVVI